MKQRPDIFKAIGMFLCIICLVLFVKFIVGCFAMIALVVSMIIHF